MIFKRLGRDTCSARLWLDITYANSHVQSSISTLVPLEAAAGVDARVALFHGTQI